MEYLTEILQENDIELSAKVLPWRRAIEMARNNHFDGLLTAVQSEAPDFHLTTTPTGHYQVCLFKKARRNITYINRESLSGLTLGGINDYGYGEPLDSVISDPRKHEKVYLISNTDPLKTLIRLVESERIDLFIEDRAVASHHLINVNKQQLIKSAGCLPQIPFYTAFSPRMYQSREWALTFNTLLSKKKSIERYKKAMQEYGVLIESQ